jgi:hypothetical protein
MHNTGAHADITGNIITPQNKGVAESLTMPQLPLRMSPPDQPQPPPMHQAAAPLAHNMKKRLLIYSTQCHHTAKTTKQQPPRIP